MATIQAVVSSRILSKADRLFPGTLDGRIIEILQNARRAKATHVWIANKPTADPKVFEVTVRDNGEGIQDFQSLLSLGAKGWSDTTDEAEDPAGIGFFSLVPRTVNVQSRGQQVTITKETWAGAPTEVQSRGTYATSLTFEDQAWSAGTVVQHSRYTDLCVRVDGVVLEMLPFVETDAPYEEYPELGVRIQIKPEIPAGVGSWHGHGTVNFYGHLIDLPGFNFPRNFQGHAWVEMTGDPSPLRMMLPARTQLYENAALQQLLQAVQRSIYLAVQRLPEHTIPYADYRQALAMGIELPEAIPTFEYGLFLGDNYVDPVEIEHRLPLAQCCCFGDECVNEASVDELERTLHYLAVHDETMTDFCPVTLDLAYQGYSWFKWPTRISSVKIKPGARLMADDCYGNFGEHNVRCVESLEVTVGLADGRSLVGHPRLAFRDDSLLTAEEREQDEHLPSYRRTTFYVTPAAQEVNADEFFLLFSLYYDDGDLYSSQLEDFSDDWTEFWADLVGPYESVRRNLFQQILGLDADHRKWQEIRLLRRGGMEVVFDNGERETVNPPA